MIATKFPFLLTLTLRLLACLLLVQAIFMTKSGLAETPAQAVKYDKSQFSASFLSPGKEVVLTVDWLTSPEERVMALTFDDGPDLRDLQIAALLKDHDIPATFFYIGNKIKNMPDIVKAIHSYNHVIGYHSWYHQYLGSFTPSALENDFDRGRTIMENLGVKATLFRPPYGDFNPKVIDAAKEQGMETILWTIDSRDWTGVNSSTIARTVIRQFHPGAVLLFHSIHAATLQALPEIIAAATKQNYRFVSLAEWKQTILIANCRMSGSPCPDTHIVASQAKPKSVTILTAPAPVEPIPDASAQDHDQEKMNQAEIEKGEPVVEVPLVTSPIQEDVVITTDPMEPQQGQPYAVENPNSDLLSPQEPGSFFQLQVISD